LALFDPFVPHTLFDFSESEHSAWRTDSAIDAAELNGRDAELISVLFDRQIALPALYVLYSLFSGETFVGHESAYNSAKNKIQTNFVFACNSLFAVK
jgi:hypothetical protein